MNKKGTTITTDQIWQKQIKGDLAGECDGWIKLKLESRQFQQSSDMFLELSISGSDLSIQVESTKQLFMINMYRIFSYNTLPRIRDAVLFKNLGGHW